MRGGRKAAWFLIVMAGLALGGFSLYSRLTGDSQRITAGIITALIPLLLAALCSLDFRP